MLGGTAVVAGLVGGAHLLDVDDDLLRLAGARPRPMPDAGDEQRVRAAATEQAGLVAALGALATAFPDVPLEPLQAVAEEQLRAVGGADVPPVDAPGGGQGAAVQAVAEQVAATARRREQDAAAAVSPALVRVLASMAAGQAQLARTLGRLA